MPNTKTAENIDPIVFLDGLAPGFKDLAKEQIAIMHFSLLWGYFEGKALDTNASADRIIAITNEWSSKKCLQYERFAKHLEFFRQRYFRKGIAQSKFQKLHLRRNDSPDLVRKVLIGENMDPADCVAVLLIVVLRLRNNLFHGIKWQDELRGQLENFQHANAILMAAIETHQECHTMR